MNVLPYIILHVPVETYAQQVAGLSAEQNGYYLIFWWKNIPLGDLYIEAGHLPDKEEMEKKILGIIKPAVDFYCTKLHLPGTASSEGLKLGEDKALAAQLNAIDTAFNRGPLPDKVDISVIICTRNRTRRLKACLDSLQNSTCRPAEIIVVDNAPSDDETKNLVGHYKGVTYCHEPRPGLDAARNTGAYTATCPIIAYTDDDILVHPLWAYEIWSSFLDPEIAAITGLVFAAELNSEAQQIFEKYWSFNRGYTDKIYDNTFFKSSRRPPVWEIGAGASMAFRKSVLETTGYFDERLDVGAAGCNGDSELWYRFLLKGYTILYNPRVISYHSHRPDFAGLKKQIFNYIRGNAAASLIQQEQNRKAAYRKYVYWELPKYYLLLLRCGFPSYSSRYSTLFSEVKGLVSGIIYFRKHRHSPSQNVW